MRRAPRRERRRPAGTRAPHRVAAEIDQHRTPGAGGLPWCTRLLVEIETPFGGSARVTRIPDGSRDGMWASDHYGGTCGLVLSAHASGSWADEADGVSRSGS